MIIEEKEIYLCKTKSILFFSTSIVCFLIGLWILNTSVLRINVIGINININKDEMLPYHIIATILTIFFGLCSYNYYKKLLITSPILILNKEGIISNSNDMLSYNGLIPWKEITEITELNIKNRRFALLQVENPNKYITGNIIQRKIKKLMVETYGTPLFLESQTLEVNFEELIMILLICNLIK